MVNALDLARAGGRLAPGAGADPGTAVGMPVLRLLDGKLDTVGHAATADDAADTMAKEVRSAGLGLRVAIGVSDRSSSAVAEGAPATLLLGLVP